MIERFRNFISRVLERDIQTSVGICDYCYGNNKEFEVAELPSEFIEIFNEAVEMLPVLFKSSFYVMVYRFDIFGRIIPISFSFYDTIISNPITSIRS